MIAFPRGKKKETFKTKDFDMETYIYFLIEDGFTGVLNIFKGNTKGELLFIDGSLSCAHSDGKVGNDAIKEIIKIEGTADVYYLEKERAAYAFHWYKVVKEAPLVSWGPEKKVEIRKEEIERVKLMSEMGIRKPSKKEIKKILETEEMDFLSKN
ncbi:MAG: hypothetical protein U9N35_05630 [Euryarchaeota archaeon]|nr:hypothetical protein [Euryarchaeota archaeon]